MVTLLLLFLAYTREDSKFLLDCLLLIRSLAFTQPSNSFGGAHLSFSALLVLLSVRAPQKEGGFYLISNQYESAAATTPPLAQNFALRLFAARRATPAVLEENSHHFIPWTSSALFLSLSLALEHVVKRIHPQ
jgi:hypothetical protein